MIAGSPFPTGGRTVARVARWLVLPAGSHGPSAPGGSCPWGPPLDKNASKMALAPERTAGVVVFRPPGGPLAPTLPVVGTQDFRGGASGTRSRLVGDARARASAGDNAGPQWNPNHSGWEVRINRGRETLLKANGDGAHRNPRPGCDPGHVPVNGSRYRSRGVTPLTPPNRNYAPWRYDMERIERERREALGSTLSPRPPTSRGSIPSRTGRQWDGLQTPASRGRTGRSFVRGCA